ncbi:MAG: hypothetical protein FJ299_11615, partial [Planctomycetes bacterium]|nr:hypothetical protein [Planctomycetota bacterium]
MAGACRAPLARQPSVPIEAEAAFEQALDRAFLVRSGALAADEHGSALLAVAERLAPDWWAVARARQDELRRSDGALAAYTLALERRTADESNAQAAYLLARLEGAGGAALFERSRVLAPRDFWPWHGLAQLALGRDDRAEAHRLERRALERARSGYERVLAYETLLQCADALREPASVDELRNAAERDLSDALPLQRARLRARCASVFLAHPDPARREQAWSQARDLLLGETLSARDQIGLFAQWLRLFGGDEGRLVQLRAIHARWPATLRHSAELPDEAGSAEPQERAAAFARLEPSRALSTYLDALPSRVREACLDGQLALDRALRFEAAGEPDARDEAARQLSVALLRLGWHAESQAFARALVRAAESAGEPTRAAGAQKLLHRAESALALERDVLDAFDAHAAGRPFVLSRHAASDKALPRSALIADVLARLDRVTQAWWPGLLVDAAQPSMQESPMLDFSPLGVLVHPGPWYGEADERAGRGTQGGEVPGLARLAAALGRFALLGRALTVGSDGCWMTKVAARREAGEQFGTRWSGTTVFCDGARFPIGPARAGAEIAGLAVHDGYWIDLASLRAWAARIDAGRAIA